MTIIEYLVRKDYKKTTAERIIRSGKVFVNSECIFVPSIKLKKNDEVTIKESKKWVSRGALKLLQGIKEFKIDFKNKIVLDIGSSTGGFTQVALNYGAKHIYALDVGTNQLDYSLRQNIRITSIEKTNLKNIKKNMFQHNIDIIVADVSFISLKEVFKIIDKIKIGKEIYVLIKPQFEALRNDIKHGGIVELEKHKSILNKIKNDALVYNLKITNIIKLKIVGKKSKNIEYFAKIIGDTISK